MSPAIVKTRADRYNLIIPNPLKPEIFTIRVYNAISVVGDSDFPLDRAWALQQIYSSNEFIADNNGAGGVWQHNKYGKTFKVSILTKLAMLGILKFSTLDPMGMGVEMEGGKPGWNDAMNGLPGLIGSGMAETYEMLRIIQFVKLSVTKYNRGIKFPEEFVEFVLSLENILLIYDKSEKDKISEYQFWDASNNAREKYRLDTTVYFSGKTIDISSTHVLSLLSAMEIKINRGINRALSTVESGISPSYFYYECTSYGIIKLNGTGTIPPKPILGTPSPVPTVSKIYCKEFTTHTLPIFLEGAVRYMKIQTEKKKIQDVYERTKLSGIYDNKLKMYKLSESLENMGQDVGRMKAFSPGWLENQSIWLHMSYKYYLELLKKGLYLEFYNEISTGLVPFMDNKKYGRSPIEAASFIVSSSFPDNKLHGQSFLARLTGSTAEMMSIWIIMMTGHKIFSIDKTNGLLLTLDPILPGWLFDMNGKISFIFLSEILVTYHNLLKVDTWTISPKACKVTYKDGTYAEYDDAVLKGKVAERVRSLQVSSIDIFY